MGGVTPDKVLTYNAPTNGEGWGGGGGGHWACRVPPGSADAVQAGGDRADRTGRRLCASSATAPVAECLLHCCRLPLSADRQCVRDRLLVLQGQRHGDEQGAVLHRTGEGSPQGPFCWRWPLTAPCWCCPQDPNEPVVDLSLIPPEMEDQVRAKPRLRRSTALATAPLRRTLSICCALSACRYGRSATTLAAISSA